MSAYAILNPYAGRWKALRRREEAENALRAAGISYEFYVTSQPREGIEIARRAVLDGFSPILALGGDGSISEVVNGMALATVEGRTEMPPLGVLPLGSADDFADNLGLPKDLEEAARIIAGGRIRRIDLCKLQWRSAEAENVHFFDNNAAIGLEPYITLKQQKIHKIHGPLRYLVATLQGIADNPSWVMRLQWEDGDYEGPASLLTVGNSPRTGGLFYVTPHADPADGKLTFVHAYLPTRGEILRVLPRLMKAGEGNYVEHPAAHEYHSEWLRAECTPVTPLHADGEIQTHRAVTIEFTALPGRLPLLAA